MANTTFVAGTVIASSWLNDVNDHVYEYAYDVKQYGALGNGVANDKAAIQAAIDAANAAGGGVVFIPPGIYQIGSSIAMKKFVTIKGADMNATTLRPTFTGNLFNLNLTSEAPFPGSPLAQVGFQDFTIDCVAQSGVTGINLVLCREVNIQNITFKGCATNVSIDRGRSHSLHTLFVKGTTTLPAGGFVLTSTDNADYCFESHVYDIQYFNNYTTGVVAIMFLLRRCALVEISNVTINDGYQGQVTATAAFVLENDCQGCSISDSIVAAVSYGILMRQGAGPAAFPTYSHITNVDIDQARTRGIEIQGGSYNIFTAVKVSSSGVLPTLVSSIVTSGAGSNQFIGCQWDNYNGVGGRAIDINNATGTMIRDCIFSNCSTGITIDVNSTSTTIFGNQFAGVTTQIAGTPAQAAVSIKNNTGHRLTGVNFAPAVPASTVAATNNNGYTVMVYLSGGTVTAVNINGSSFAAASPSGGYRIEPGDTIAITYAVAPTWVWLPTWG